MKAGKLRTLLTIEKRGDTPDGMGGSTTTWTTFGTVYGRQIIRRADSEFKADQLSSVQVSRWETRFLTGITPKMRLVSGSRVFEIEAVYDPSQKRERLEIVCTELQNPGV